MMEHNKKNKTDPIKLYSEILRKISVLPLSTQKEKEAYSKELKELDKEIKKMGGKLLYKLRVYDKNKKFLEDLEFNSFKELEDFILELFEKGYQINKIVDTSQILTEIYAPDNPSVGIEFAALPDVKEIWFYNKKEKKYFVFLEPKHSEGKDLYLLLANYFPLNKAINKRQIASSYKKRKKEEKEFKKKEKRLIKIQGKFYRGAEKQHQKEKRKWLKELEKINEVIKKLPKRKNRKH